MLIKGKKCMLQPKENNYIYKSIAKVNIQWFFNFNCKSKYTIYLMKCILRRIQYVGKVEEPQEKYKET